MKGTAFALVFVATLALAVVAPSVAGTGLSAEFEVTLSGAQQVPPVVTAATGSFEVQLVNQGTALVFELEVCDIVGVTMAHIHFGPSGANGPIVLFLFHAATGSFSAEGCEDLASGTLTPANLITVPGIMTWGDFVAALLAGNTYANVHTIANPGGEIRGQIVAEAED